VDFIRHVAILAGTSVDANWRALGSLDHNENASVGYDLPVTDYRFDFALSFAGEDRVFANDLAASLKAVGARVFYDQDFTAELWGEDLGLYLDRVYRAESRFAIVVISHHYATKAWTNHEFRSAIARTIELKTAAYILPIRLDDSEVPGLRSTSGFIDGTKLGVARIAALAVEKLGNSPSAPYRTATSARFAEIPISSEERRRVATERPVGWEYLLLAGAVWNEMRVDDKGFLDNQLGYAEASSEYIDTRADLQLFTERKLNEARRIMSRMTLIANTDSLTWAVGKPGEPGDPVKIDHFAHRLGSSYRDLLAWSAAIRGATCPPEYVRALNALAHFTDAAIKETRDFAERLVNTTKQIMSHASLPEPRSPLIIELELVMTIDDRVVKEFNREMRRLR
jgi:hypothetical protein